MTALPLLRPEACERAYRDADEAMAERLETIWFVTGGESSCRRGCSHCCYKPAVVEVREVSALVAGVRALSMQQRTRVRHRLRDWWASVRQAAIDLDADDHVVVRGLDEARLPCPPLEGGDCMIYQHRPLSCRLHAIIGNEADRCADPQARLDFVDARDLQAEAWATLFQEVPGRVELRLIPEWLSTLQKAGLL